MEINEKHIIKGLECCTRGRKSNEDRPCLECPYNECNLVGGTRERQTKGTCQGWLMKDALSLIKELTEENERLRVVADMSDTTLTDSLRIVNEFYFKRAKADIVKEMQEKIKQRMDDFARIDGGKQTFYLISKSVIDQIAKEILEEKEK